MTVAYVDLLVRELLPRLGLSHWNVTVDWGTFPRDGAEAETLADNSYDQATLRFSPESHAWDARHAHLVVVHELVHLITRDLERAMDDVVDVLPSGTARALARSRFTHEVEGVVDRIAAALVGFPEEGR